MKIKEIKSNEVREEALRLAMSKDATVSGRVKDKEEALDTSILFGFFWHLSPQKEDFWRELELGIIKNTKNLKLPTNEN